MLVAGCVARRIVIVTRRSDHDLGSVSANWLVRHRVDTP